MSYNYQEQRKQLFTEEGVKLLCKVRDQAQHLLKVAGAFRATEVLKECSGDSWEMLATLDYLVEQGELVCVSQPGVWAQYKIYTTARSA